MHAIVLARVRDAIVADHAESTEDAVTDRGEHRHREETLDALERDDRIDDVYVSTNEKFADEFDAYLDEAAYEKPELSVEDTEADAEKFGIVGALAMLTARLARRSHSEAIPPVSPRYCSSIART